MLVRVFVLFAFVCGFSADEGFAMLSSEKSRAPVKSTKTTVKKKATKKTQRKAKVHSRHRLPVPILMKTLSVLSSEIMLSPISTEKKIFSSPRSKLAVLPRPIPSPYARKTLLKAISTSYFKKSIFKDKVIYRAPSLFNWNDLILTQDTELGFKWETNLERTLRGAPPIAYKGIPTFVPLDEIDAEKAKIIRAQQHPYIVQIHHLTQRDGKENELDGASNNPLVWMTAIGHRSGNARFILEIDRSGGLKIVHKDLTKEEAEKKCLPHQWISTNNLHFRGKEPSKIDRSEFDVWRAKHWKSEGEAELMRRSDLGKKEDDQPFPHLTQRLSFGPSTLDDDF